MYYGSFPNNSLFAQTNASGVTILPVISTRIGLVVEQYGYNDYVDAAFAASFGSSYTIHLTPIGAIIPVNQTLRIGGTPAFTTVSALVNFFSFAQVATSARLVVNVRGIIGSRPVLGTFTGTVAVTVPPTGLVPLTAVLAIPASGSYWFNCYAVDSVGTLLSEPVQFLITV